ncbi:MAG: hypothetical protein ACI85K_001043, partial [Hyphomicrobiaceae bacterium]
MNQVIAVTMMVTGIRKIHPGRRTCSLLALLMFLVVMFCWSYRYWSYRCRS